MNEVILNETQKYLIYIYKKNDEAFNNINSYCFIFKAI